MMYPLKFEVILKSILWGGSEICKFKNLSTKLDGIGESWEISQVKDNVSVIANGEYKGKNLTELIQEKGAELLGQHVLDRLGDKFPLLIKFIDARDNLSIQVHPNESWLKSAIIHLVKQKCGMLFLHKKELGCIQVFLSKLLRMNMSNG